MTQQGDVRIFQTLDGGDVVIEAGVIAMDGGLETAVYLSLFGGNDNDPAGDDKTFSWWGNLSEPDPSRRYRSETQYLLRGMAANSANLRRLEAAVKRDLAWMLSEGVASAVDASVTVPGLNKVRIQVTVVADGEESDFVFAENWKAGA